MKTDYSSGLVLSNGDLLEASYESRFGWDGNINWVERKIYTGCFITKPNGDKIWRSNSWCDEFPISPDYIIDDYDYDQSASWQVFVNLSVSVSSLTREINRSIEAVNKLKAAL